MIIIQTKKEIRNRQNQKRKKEYIIKNKNSQLSIYILKTTHKNFQKIF
jgi:hypothetical protein